MRDYPNPCDTCEKSKKCPGCIDWEIRYKYRQKLINAWAKKSVQPVLIQKQKFAYSHPDDVREFLRHSPCESCKAEKMCEIPCKTYWKWWDLRMDYFRRRFNL